MLIEPTPEQRARWLAAALVRRTYAGGMDNSSEFGFDIDALLNLCAAVAQEAIERHEEKKGAPKLEELLEQLSDFHARNETLAEGCDMTGSAKWHKGQREIISEAAKNGGAFISPQEAVAAERGRLFKWLDDLEQGTSVDWIADSIRKGQTP